MNQEPDDFGVTPGEFDSRWDPHDLETFRSSYGDHQVLQDVRELERDPEHRPSILEHRKRIMDRGDLLYAVVICPNHRVFINGRHRLSAALWVGMSSIPTVHQCWCENNLD